MRSEWNTTLPPNWLPRLLWALLTAPWRWLRWFLGGLRPWLSREVCEARAREGWRTMYGRTPEISHADWGWRTYTFYLDWTTAYPHVTVDRVTGAITEIGGGRPGSPGPARR